MHDVLAAILDTLIPESADGRMPGAGSLDLVETIRAETGGAAALLEAGFATLGEDFAGRPLDERVSALQACDAAHPGFALTLYAPLCTHYYRHPKVLVALGMRPGPPHPEGHELAPGNLDALERVRARRPLYRDV